RSSTDGVRDARHASERHASENGGRPRQHCENALRLRLPYRGAYRIDLERAASPAHATAVRRSRFCGKLSVRTPAPPTLSGRSAPGSALLRRSEDCGVDGIRTEIVRRPHLQNRRQLLACPIGAALHRADRAAADGGRFLIGKARRPDEKQRLALVLWQLGERAFELLEIEMSELRGLLRQRRGKPPLRVGNLTRQLTEFRVERVSQNGK